MKDGSATWCCLTTYGYYTVFAQMRRLHLLIVAVLAAYFPAEKTEAARILSLMTYKWFSHFLLFENYMKSLVSHGHHVTVVGYFPQKQQIENYTDISLQGSLPEMKRSFNIQEIRRLGILGVWNLYWKYQVEICEAVFKHPNMQKLLNSDEKFDLVVTHLLGSDCILGFAHKFKAPLISLSTSVVIPWGNYRIGNVDNPSYVPNYFLPFTDRMNLWQRVLNTLYNVASIVGQYIFSEIPSDDLSNKYFGPGVPPLSELKKKTSLLIVNSHFTLNSPRPMVPAVVEVAGLHINKRGKLSHLKFRAGLHKVCALRAGSQLMSGMQDIEDFLNSSTEGVIYFSLGSVLESESLPRETLQTFIDVFSRLPQRVLWKIGNVSGLSGNVKCASWFSQLEILMHPNVRVFITHGGLLGTQEAIYAGVPMLGIPIAFDQELNIRTYVTKGVAIQLDYESMSADSLLTSINELLNDPRYQKNAKHLSQLFRDRPQAAMDTAIYWTEYVIRHRGAPHLRSSALDLSWYQYLLLDVALVTYMTLMLIAIYTCYICSKTVRKLKGNCKNLNLAETSHQK
ncbi:UDP-glucosyltransferase 2-like [Periplaneta americana]|uniref:UDP-glucosyltransferase 2-like n=1 Tax=Periplaneta americana TaxID=6978 RepID=UPI0037E72168